MKLTQEVQVELTIRQRAELLIEQKAKAESDLEKAKAEIESLVIENNGEAFFAEGRWKIDDPVQLLKVELSQREGRETLDQTKLLLNGVPITTIKASTNKGEGYTQLNVRKASKADLAKEAV